MDTRSRLLAAGARLFAASGYDKTTVGDIEREAGLSPRAGGFYRHFESKEAILLTIAGDLFETPERIGLTDAFPLGDTRAELVYIARAYDRLNDKGDALSHVIRVEAARIPELMAMIERANTRMIDALTEWIAAKPGLEGKSAGAARELTMTVFGGWLFYVSRREEISAFPGFNFESLLNQWADVWAPLLDGEATRL